MPSVTPPYRLKSERVLGPVRDTEVRGIDDFVGAPRFIDHLFSTAPAGAADQRIASVEQFAAFATV